MISMTMETVTIPKEEYEKLKQEARIDLDLLQQLMNSFREIKEGRAIRVK